MGRETPNALERVARLERENAELRARIERARAGEPPRPPMVVRVNRFAIMRWMLLTIGTAVGLRFAISATHAERSAAEAPPPSLPTCEAAP